MVTTSAATCEGGPKSPYSQASYWTTETTSQGVNGTSFLMSLCRPPEACIGNNACAPGYTGTACSLCVPKLYSRNLLDGTCIPCPNNAPWVLSGYCIGILAVAYLFRVIATKGPSVAALSIILNYLQVVSMFGSLELNWPPVIITILQFMSLATANIEVTSPECSISVGYINKWYFFQSIPILLSGMFATVTGIGILACLLTSNHHTRLWVRGCNRRFWSPYLRLLSSTYVFLMRQGFDALKCTYVGTDMKLAVDPSVDCTTPEYLTMRSWAILSVVLYAISIPLL